VARVRWRRKALDDLDRLDRWREHHLRIPPIGPAILILIGDYFSRVDLTQYLPGAPVFVDGPQADMRLLLLSVRCGEPYKIFYRPLPEDGVAEVLRIRHPRQKPLKRP